MNGELLEFGQRGSLFNGELREFYELGREPVGYWRITRIGAGAGLDAPCPAGRNLVNLVNYCAARIYVRVRGRLNLVDFSPEGGINDE